MRPPVWRIWKEEMEIREQEPEKVGGNFSGSFLFKPGLAPELAKGRRKNVFRDYGIYGVILAIFIVLISYSIQPKAKRTFSIFKLISMLIVFPLLLISIVTFVNRYNAEKVINPLESIVLKKESRIDEKDEKDSEYWVFANVGIYREKFKIESELWNTLQERSAVQIERIYFCTNKQKHTSNECKHYICMVFYIYFYSTHHFYYI